MSARTIRAVVFDLDGTLVDTMVSVPQAYVDTVRRLGGPALSPDDVVSAWNLGPAPVVLAHLLDRDIDAEDVEVFFDEIDRAAATAVAFDGIHALLDALDAAALATAVLTNASHRGAAQLLSATGLAQRFELVLGADQVRKPKPYPDGLLDVSDRLGVTAADIAYVGDAQSDIDAANAAGALAVFAGWCGRPAPRRGAFDHAPNPGEVIALLG